MDEDESLDRAYFEDQFEAVDPWSFATSEYERRKYARQINALGDHAGAVSSILEVGCAEGVHSEQLLDAFPEASLVGVDISERAIERARDRNAGREATFVAGDAFDVVEDLDGPFDVVVWSETIYYMGARVPLPELAAFVETLVDRLADGGLLCLANIHRQPEAPESAYTAAPLMRAYFELLSEYAEVVHRAKYRDYKAESEQAYRYEVWVFRGGSGAD